MNAKLISIFTAAGVVAAGSTAFAINNQTLRQNKDTSIISPERLVDQSSSELDTEPITDSSEAPNTADDQALENGVPEDSSVSDGLPNLPIPADQTAADQIDSAPTESIEPTPTLPSVPPSFKPGKGDDEDDSEYEDDEDEFENHDEDSEHEDEFHWEDDD